MQKMHTDRVDLDALIAFHAVCRLGSVSAAADELAIGQPTLSRRVRALEAELGVQLFHRTGRGMAPTAEGTAFESWTNEPVERLVRAAERIRAGADEHGMLLRIGIIPTVGAAITGPLTERLVRELPHARLRIREAYSAMLIDALHRDELDLAVIYGSSPQVRLKAVVVASEPLAALCRPGVLPPGTITMAELVQRPMVLPSTLHGLRSVVDEAFDAVAAPQRRLIEADGFDGLKDLVMRGLGVSVLPVSSVAREIASGLLEAHAIDPEPPRRPIAVADAPGQLPSRTVAAARSIIIDQLRAAMG